VIGVDSQRGVIAPGRLADMILVDGDPAMRIEDIHRVSTVFKGGHVYDPAQIEKALGISPRPAPGSGS
jgi:imidazolonepropionase-like amidohydrolase